MKRIVCLAGIFVLSALFPVSALQVGDLDIGFRAGVGGEYSDNITAASRNELQDWLTTLRFGLDATLEGKTQFLKFSGDVARHQYDQNNTFNNTSENASLEYRREFSRYSRMTLTERFVHANVPTGFEDEFNRTGGLYSYSRNTVGGTYQHDLTSKLSLTAGYTNERSDYSDDGPTDTRGNNGSLEAAYALSSADVVFGVYEYIGIEYVNSVRFRTNRLAGGWRHFFTSQLYVDGRGGLDFVRDSVSRKTTEQDFISVSLTNEPDESTRLVLSYLKQGGAGTTEQAIRESWRLSLTGFRQLLERLSANISGYYGEGEYSSIAITDTYQGISAGLAYDVTKDLRASLTYSYTNFGSNVETREYERNRISLSATYSF